MATADAVTALALAAAGGDRAALAEFIRATQADVWRFVAHLAGVAAADDLTQETFLRVLTALPAFEGRSSARAWLLAIARRAVVDRIRHDRARPRLVAVDGSLDELVAEHADPSNGHGAAALLGLLGPERREALVLTQLMGFTYAETAEICACAVGTVRSRVARARADLVEALARQDAPASRR
ncbi:sigma-70 family RNA polymerase sigma factor [Propionicicella superfundia]|uniref:sigma-70 family RNA polymerase sigma factor n=1 Tax=Propionicicella superfundia TaxID=348582 RepID=UPI00041206C3|nr:sigma-70 family RNA polymerase sigma factor [Propionicicella superfundia]